MLSCNAPKCQWYRFSHSWMKRSQLSESYLNIFHNLYYSVPLLVMVYPRLLDLIRILFVSFLYVHGPFFFKYHKLYICNSKTLQTVAVLLWKEHDVYSKRFISRNCVHKIWPRPVMSGAKRRNTLFIKCKANAFLDAFKGLYYKEHPNQYIIFFFLLSNVPWYESHFMKWTILETTTGMFKIVHRLSPCHVLKLISIPFQFSPAVTQSK